MIIDTGYMERPTIIESARKARGLKQGELARLAGTAQSSISEYERRRKSPTLDVVERLLHAADADLGMVTRVRFETRRLPRGREFFVPDRLWRVELPWCFERLHFPDMTRGTDQEYWDLADRTDRTHAYEILLVLGSDGEILRSVDGALLVDCWDDLRLPDLIRDAWAPVIAAASPH